MHPPKTLSLFQQQGRKGRTEDRRRYQAWRVLNAFELNRENIRSWFSCLIWLGMTYMDGRRRTFIAIYIMDVFFAIARVVKVYIYEFDNGCVPPFGFFFLLLYSGCIHRESGAGIRSRMYTVSNDTSRPGKVK